MSNPTVTKSLPSLSTMGLAVAKWSKACEKVTAAEKAGRSYSTMQRLYREMFRAEDHMKALGV